LLLAAGLLDWVTGPYVASSVFYLPAIIWMAWKGGRWLGLGTALASGVTWLALVLISHKPYPNHWIPFWNGFVRTLSFSVVSGLLSEVMERKRLEGNVRQAREDLAQQAGILESILNSMEDGVVVADSQGRLMHINPAARRMLRIPSAGTNIMGWLASQENFLPDSPTEVPSDENPLLRAVRGGAVSGAEMFLRHAAPAAGIWLSVSSRPLVDQGGGITGGVIVFSDISARKSLERQIAEVSDREQRRIGEDLHDGLCQHLVSVAFAARRLAGKLAEQSLREAEDAAQIAELVGESIAQARVVARGLYVVPREAGGLRSALEEFVMQVRSRHRIACQFVERVSVPIVGEVIVTNLFRIAQEAVNNAIKHAQAGHISVTLAADEEQIRLTIEDDGAGFRPDARKTRGMGLHLMAYRARVVGAALRIEPGSAGGTMVSCLVRRENLMEQGSDVERN